MHAWQIVTIVSSVAAVIAVVLVTTSREKRTLDDVINDGTTGELRVRLARGENPNGTDRDGWPLLVAILHRNHEAMRVLLAAGADANLGGPPPLLYAESGRDHEAMRLLVALQHLFADAQDSMGPSCFCCPASEKSDACS